MNARIIVHLLAVSCVCMGMCVAQVPTPAQAPTAVPAAKPWFAIEYPGEKGSPLCYETFYEASPNSGYIATCKPLLNGEWLHRLANSDPAIRQPSELELVVKVEGDEATITPVVYYGEIDPKALSIPLEKMEKQTLESYSGKLNDSITLSALERVGLEPMTLKIVPVQTEHPYQPLTRSNAPSLDMEYAPGDRTSGTVTIHNRSSKAVVALQFGRSDGWSQEAESGRLKELIAPGANYQSKVDSSPSWEKAGGKTVEHPLPTYLTLNAVVFADGSYEGDMQTAAELFARSNGSVAQRQRILSLIETNLADTRLDDMVKAGLIRAAVKQLSEDPDAQMIADFRAQFPTLSDSGYSDAKNALSWGMKIQKESLDSVIEQFESKPGTNSSRKGHPVTLEHWLDAAYAK